MKILQDVVKKVIIIKCTISINEIYELIPPSLLQNKIVENVAEMSTGFKMKKKVKKKVSNQLLSLYLYRK